MRGYGGLCSRNGRAIVRGASVQPLPNGFEKLKKEVRQMHPPFCAKGRFQPKPKRHSFAVKIGRRVPLARRDKTASKGQLHSHNGQEHGDLSFFALPARYHQLSGVDL